MPNAVTFMRVRRALLVGILFAAWAADESGAGPQRDQVCQGRSGLKCPGSPAPQIFRGRSPNISNNPAPVPDRGNTTRPIDPAEEQRDRLNWEKVARVVKKNWLPISSMGIAKMPSETVSIAPGSDVFNTVPSDPISFTAPIAHVAMSGTPIPDKALRRAVTILAAAQSQLQSSPAGNEEIAFLASQAALALEGAPLQVIVSEDIGDDDAARAADELRPVVATIGQHEATRAGAVVARNQAIEAYGELKKDQDAGGIDPPQNTEKQKALAKIYDSAGKRASIAKKQLADDNRKVEAIIKETFVLDDTRRKN